MDVIFKGYGRVIWQKLVLSAGFTRFNFSHRPRFIRPDLLQKERLAKKFDMVAGERGVKLSGSEKQRITVARAFLEDAPIVVLDEATSALDSLTEQQIQTAIFELIKHKTALVIAHRLKHGPHFVALEKGKIIEQGTHQQLLAKQSKYYAMWQHQSGDFLIE